MNDDFEKDMKEVADEAMGVTGTSSEAPRSLHIDGYFMGFHVGLTQRDANQPLMPLVEKAEKGVRELIKRGWEPSWNKDTTKGHLTPSGASQATTSGQERVCTMHTDMQVKQS